MLGLTFLGFFGGFSNLFEREMIIEGDSFCKFRFWNFMVKFVVVN